MPYAPLVVTDETDSTARSAEEIERPEKELSHLDGFHYVHWVGLPHRTVQIEIVNPAGCFFLWQRRDDRLEIPGGHVDWLVEENRAETYEEAARRETVEELRLDLMWNGEAAALSRLHGRLTPVTKMINQTPGSHLNNNEWVTVFRLCWPGEWQDPCALLQREELELEGKAGSARWMSFEEIRQTCLSRPMEINAALRLFMARRGVMVPFMMSEYDTRYDQYRSKFFP